MDSAQGGPTVSFRRTGGMFAGNVLTTSVSVDDLEGPQRKALQRHLADADLAALAARSPIRGAGADIYQYALAVDDSSGHTEVVVAQTAVPDTLWPLIDWLEQRAIRGGR